jgi:hypothetical protein
MTEGQLHECVDLIKRTFKQAEAMGKKGGKKVAHH